MNKLLKFSGPVFVLALAASAYATPIAANGPRWHEPPPPRGFQQSPPNIGHVAPEVDPNLAIGGFTLLAGTLTVMRSRRRK